MPRSATMNDTLLLHIFIETKILNDRKSLLAAYIMWAVLAPFSAHRIYFGRKYSALMQSVLFFSAIGTGILYSISNLGFLFTLLPAAIALGWVAWMLLDIVLMPRMAAENVDYLRRHYHAHYLGKPGP
jgi:hypothetical protein